jgi:diguanylate cyclase (GGDEF)-like protein/PAS domain S-box-containing protein
MSKRRKNMKNYLKSFYILTTAFAIIFFTVILFLYIYTSNLVEQNQENKILHELDDVDYEVNDFFDDIIVTLENVIGYLQTEPTDQELLDYLVILDNQSESIDSIYLGRSDKTMVNSSGFIPPFSFDLTTRPWYVQAIASEEIIYTSAFLNATQDRMIVNVAKKVYVNDIFIGVLSTDVDITTISETIAQTEVGTSGFAFLFDGNQNFIAYPGMNAHNIELVSIDEYFHFLEHDAEEDLKYQVKVDGRVGVLAEKLTLNDTFTVGIFIPQAEYYQTTTLMLYIFIFFLIFMVVLTTGLILINQFFILQPIRMLVSDIEVIDVYRRPNYRMPIADKLGYTQIRHALNEFLNTTSKYFREKEQARHELLLENQRVVLLMNSAADIIFEINHEKKFVTVLGRGLERIGRKPEDFIGKTVLDIFGAEGENRDYHYQRALEGHRSFYYWKYKTSDGILHFESSISPIYDENKTIVGAVGITRDITEQQQKQDEIEHISTHDFLTGLYNRRYFVQKLAEYDKDDFYPLGIMMMDLNGLKILNDAYGHNLGDEALVSVSKVLTKHLGKYDLIFRIGGDEFSAILPNITEERIYELKKVIAEDISKHTVSNLDLSLAIGYAIKTSSDQKIDLILKEAEDYMYRIKLSEGRSVRNNAIKAILKTLTDKYKDERVHLEKVSQICKEMGHILGLQDDEIRELELAGLYHDIGKISIPDAILNKPGKLTKEEYEFMKTHTEAGYQILRAADGYSNLAEYALTHHERWDGSGYPRQLKGIDIPYVSRILSIVDAYEAMISKRVYKEPMTKQEAIDEIIRCSGSQFDPDLAKIFVTKYLKEKWTEQ